MLSFSGWVAGRDEAAAWRQPSHAAPRLARASRSGGLPNAGEALFFARQRPGVQPSVEPRWPRLRHRGASKSTSVLRKSMCVLIFHGWDLYNLGVSAKLPPAAPSARHRRGSPASSVTGARPLSRATSIAGVSVAFHVNSSRSSSCSSSAAARSRTSSSASGLSYPTVVRRLDQVVDAMGGPSEPGEMLARVASTACSSPSRAAR